MKMTTLMSCLLVASFAATANAAAVFEITETYAGISGPDGTADWFELTNFGDMTGSTAGLYYDDDSDDPTENTPLPTFSLAPGESAVFLLEALPADITEFANVWGAGINVGALPVAGKLSGGGDAVFVYDGNTAGANVIDTVSYTGALVGQQTIEYTAAGSPSLSVIGVNGAYESAPFENTNLALPPGTDITLVGSPGFAVTVPEPTAALLMVAALAGLAATRSRG